MHDQQEYHKDSKRYTDVIDISEEIDISSIWIQIDRWSIV